MYGMSGNSRPQKKHERALFDRIGQNLASMKQCPLCQRAYSANDISVLFTQEPVHLIHMTCGTCANAILSIVTMSDIGISSIGMMTDLTARDVVRVHSKPSFTSDDVLAWHEFLAHEPQPFGAMLTKTE